MSGRIPQSFLNDLLDRTDLIGLIDEHVPLKKRGNVYIACCPFHQEKTPSFNVIPLKGFYHCFGCGASGNAISFLMDYLKQDFLEAVDLLADKVGLTVPRERQRSTQAKESNTLYSLLDEVSRFYQKELFNNNEAKAYLKARGLSAETVKRFQLGFAPPGWQTLLNTFPNQQQGLLQTGMVIQNEKGRVYDRYRNRIMFPIHDRKGRIVGFGGRVIDEDDTPKYLNSPETTLFHKSRELYGLHIAEQTKSESLILVEGYMDVIALSEGGITNAVATLGTATNGTHLSLLLRRHKTLYFCFDGDNAGRTAAWRALNNALPILEDGLNLSFVFLEEGQDPDSLVKSQGREAFFSRCQKALPLTDFFIAKLREEVDLSTTSGRTELISLAKAPLNTLKAGAYREILLDRLSALSRIEKARIETILITNENPAQLLPAQKNQNTKPSPLRIACALLIQHPNLLSKLAKPVNPSMLIQEGSEILVALLRIITESTTTAQLIEHWRGDKNASIINKLAIMPLNIPEQGKLSELEGILALLQKTALQAEIETMLKKAALTPLDEAERSALQEKIKRLKSTTPAD